MKVAAFFDHDSRVGRLGSDVCAATGEIDAYRHVTVSGECEAFPAPLPALMATHRFCVEKGIDAALWCSRHAAVVDPAAAGRFLREFSARPAVLGVRVAAVTGIGLRHGPRLPFIDDNVVALNVRRAEEIGYWRRPPLNACHFEKVGGGRAVLLSHLEYACERQDWEDILGSGGTFDLFGSSEGFSPLPFSLSVDIGVATCEADYSDELFHLLESNARRRGAPVFFKESLFTRLSVAARRAIFRATDFEFRKSFDEK